MRKLAALTFAVLLFPAFASAAIAFDAATAGTLVPSGTTQTISHTTSGLNRAVIVYVRSNADTVTGATYAGVPMTFVAKQASGNNVVNGMQNLFYLPNAALGTNNVVISATGGSIDGYVASYTGVSSATFDNSATAFTTSATSQSISLTPIADSSWVFFGIENNQGANTAGGGTTFRINTGGHAIVVGDNNTAVSPAAATTVSTTWSGTGLSSAIAVSFAPAVPAAPFYSTSPWWFLFQ